MSYFYGEISYSEDYSEFEFKIKNRILKEFYIRKTLPLSVTKIEFLDTYKLQIILPITKNETNEKIINATIDKVKTFLKLNNINIISTDLSLQVYFSEYIFPCYKYIFPFFIYKIIKRCLTHQNIKIENINLCIYWDDDLIDKAILNSILMKVNNIYIIVDDVNSFKYHDELDNIYNETGLNIGVFEKRNILEDCHVIIATKEINDMYNFKRSAIFIDLGNNKNKIINRRDDIIHINYIEIKYFDKQILDYELDWYLYCTNVAYRNYRNGGSSFKVLEYFKEKHIKLICAKSR